MLALVNWLPRHPATLFFFPPCSYLFSSYPFLSLAAMSSGSRRASHTRLLSTAKFRLLTWNVDMDTVPIEHRISEIVHTIRSRQVDVALLQEVSHEACDGGRSPLDMIRRLGGNDELGGYTIVEDHERVQNHPQYFVVMLYKKTFFQGQVSRQMDRWPGSQMGRSWIQIKGELRNGGVTMAFITSHLESGKDLVFASERRSQFKGIVQMMRRNLEENVISVFGGDTNLREPEVPASDVCKTVPAELKYTESLDTSNGGVKIRKVSQQGRTVPKVSDAWILAGALTDAKFTWDTLRNDNLDMSDVPFRPRSRYDRVFLLGPVSCRPKVASFELVGKERLSCGRFPSDHYGILIDIEIPVHPAAREACSNET